MKDALKSADIDKAALLTQNVTNIRKVSQQIKSRPADDSLMKKFLDVIRIFKDERLSKQ